MKPSFRISIVAVVFFFLTITIISKLFYIQIIKGHNYSIQANGQRHSISEQNPVRGNILASDGFPLAINQPGFTLWANPQEIEIDASSIANQITPYLVPGLEDIKIATDSSQEDIETLQKQMEQDTNNFLVSQLNKKDLIWVLLHKKLKKDKKEQIENLNIKGINYDEEAIRVYPEASMAGQILGFIGQDEHGKDIGYFGLEGFYNLDLSGRIGILKQEKDALNRPIPIGKFWSQKKRDGRHLQLYLDRGIQFIVEQKLKDAIDRYEAKSGSVVIMDPVTGGIMAMASYPNFDPNHFAKYDNENYINPIVSLSYEPGSTFKALIMAAGLEEGVITPDTICDTCDGPYEINEFKIRTYDNEYHPNSTMTEVLTNSDNTGMVFISRKLGKEKEIEYIENFGIGKLTGIDLQGEIAPDLRQDWKEVDQYTASFGQGLLVTPIQITTAISAIANNGNLMIPRMVDKFVESENEIKVNPKVVNKVISKETAQTLTDMMVTSVNEGHTHNLVPDGYEVAGKTGTAQVSVGGEYDEQKTIASFVGFAPADDPAFVMLTILQEPKASEWGANTAAPLFFDIADKLFIYLGIPPQS